MKKASVKSFNALIIIFLSVLSLHAQKITEGPETVIEKKSGYQRLIGSVSDGFYVMKQSSEGKGVRIFIEKCSNDFKKIFSVETKAAEIQESMNFTPVTVIQTFMSKNGVNVFFESHSSKTNMLTLFVQHVSSDGKISDVYEVSSAYLKYDHPLSIAGRMFFRVAFSPDNNLFAVIATIGDKKDDKREMTTCHIYQSDTFKEKYKREVPLTSNGRNIVTDDYALDNNGNLLFTVKYILMNKKGEVTGLSGFAMGYIESNSPTMKMFDIDMPVGKMIHDYEVKHLENGDIFICGIVTDTLAKGIRTAPINPSLFVKRVSGGTLKTQYEKIEVFAPDAISTLRESNRGTTFEYTQIFEIKNEVYIVSQVSEIVLKSGSSVLTAATTDKEIAVNKLNADGSIAWTRIVPKLHKGGGLIYEAAKPPRYSGNFHAFVMNDKINLVFMDHIENMELKPNSFLKEQVKPISGSIFGSESIISKDQAQAVLVEMDASGNSTKKSILANNPEGTNYVALRNTVIVDGRKLLLFLENRKLNIERFATLDF